MQATDKYLNRFPNIKGNQRKTYAAMMSAMDDAIGLVLAKLREKGLEEDTLIFFFSDNGGPTMVGTTINGSINFPLRGSKRQLLEGGIRVPFLAWKGRLPAGKTYDFPDHFPGRSCHSSRRRRRRAQGRLEARRRQPAAVSWKGRTEKAAPRNALLAFRRPDRGAQGRLEHGALRQDRPSISTT